MPIFASSTSLAYAFASSLLFRCGPITFTPFPPVSPAGLITTSPNESMNLDASLASEKTPNFGHPGILCFFIRFLAKDLSHSSCAAFLLGPAQGIPAWARESEIPELRGASGPITASSTGRDLVQFVTAFTSQMFPTAHSLEIFAIPGFLPLMKEKSSAPWERAIAFAIACSRAPEPTRRIFIERTSD